MVHAPITTIKSLVRGLLREQDTSNYASLLAAYAVPTKDLEPYFKWDPKHYTRNCIVRNADFELLVICYESGQSTSVHDYDSQTAWIHPVIGEVVEERYDLVPGNGILLQAERRLTPGMLGTLSNGSSIHRFANPGTERAVTLNLYAKPMSKWRVYEPGTGAAHYVKAGPE